MPVTRPSALLLLPALVAGTVAVTAPVPAAAASPGLVVSGVYGGGGNSGATFTHDYVELLNRGAAPASTSGLSVQYASAAGAFTQSLALPTATVPAGGTFLVQLARGAGGTTPLPTPDASGTIALAATSGKVALVDGTTALGCGDAARPCAASAFVDLVGYGSANLSEGAPAPTLTNTTALQRRGAGCTDTDRNDTDLVVVAPAPRGSSSTPVDCAATPAPPPGPRDVRIAQVQGSGAASPLVGQRVAVEGVVVGDHQGSGEYGGFTVQDPTPDADPATSDGVRVLSTVPVSLGDVVRVTGTVAERFTETVLDSVETVERLGTAALPAPAVLSLPFPAGPVDGRERYEGVRVTLPAGLVATDLYTLGRFGELGLTSGEPLRVARTLEQQAANARDVVLLDDGLSGQNLLRLPYTVDGDGRTLPRVGDVLAEDVTGVLSYGFDAYRVEPQVGTTAALARTAPRPAAPDAVGGDVQVASFNVLNYFTTFGGDARGADDEGELARQQAKLVSTLLGLDADVVGLVEIANDGGAALDRLVAAVNAAQPDPVDHYRAVVAPALNAPNRLGGTYGTDAIRNALVYRPAVVAPAGPTPSDPALLDPRDPAFPTSPVFDRPPAVQAFAPVGGGQQVTVLVNHFKSKGSSNARCGTPDPLAGNCDDLRERQAAALVRLVERLGAEDALLVGDLNAYEGEDPHAVLQRAGYVSATDRLPEGDRHTYSFDGALGALDHVYLSASLVPALTGVDVWHVNSPEAVAYDYNSYNQPQLYAPDPFGGSDHDPLLVGLALAQPPVADAGGPYTTRVGRDAVLDASASSDPDGDALAFAWDLDGDGTTDATGSVVRYGRGLPPGRYPVTVRVSDGTTERTATTVLTVTDGAGEVPPGRDGRA